MGVHRTARHFFMGQLFRRRGPPGLDVRDEVPLSAEPPRMDYLLVLKPEVSKEPGANDALSLRKLWPMLARVSIAEYKSPAHGYRRADLARLWGYVYLYFAYHQAPQRPSAADLSGPTHDSAEPTVTEYEDLCAVLIVSKRTPSLDADVARMGHRWEDCGDGYWRVHGQPFALYVVEVDVAGPAEHDDVLASMGHGIPTSPEARRFWMEMVGSKELAMSVQEMEDFDELMHRMLDALPPEEVLSHYKPEEVLSHYKPEERLAGLDRDHAALALPLEVLGVLPEDYLRSLSPETQAEIRRRLGKNGHAEPNGR